MDSVHNYLVFFLAKKSLGVKNSLKKSLISYIFKNTSGGLGVGEGGGIRTIWMDI